MDDASDSRSKRERSGQYNHPPPGGLHHTMPPAESAALHNYPHPPQQGAAMTTHWNPTPSPYNENSDHRPPPPDGHHTHQQPYPAEPHYTQPPPGHVVDPAYSRHGSSSAPTRSPPNAQPPQYPPPHPPPPVNGVAPHNPYYPPHPDYRDRPTYGPPDGQPNGAPAPPLHVSTSHEMMPGQPQTAPPLSYGPASAPPPGTPYGHPWGPGGYDAVYPRRKPVRAAQACDPCRQRKAKCDEGRPTCTHCKDNNLTCTYRDIPPQKNEKHVLAIQDKLESLGGSIDRMLESWKAQEKKMDILIDAQDSQLQRIIALESGRSAPPHSSRDETPKLSMSRQYTNSESHVESPYQAALTNAKHPTKSSELSRDTKHTEARKNSSLTAASNLLAWPVIKRMIPPNVTVSYVMDSESTRGILRLYGCGEGEDKGDGHDGAPSPATSSSSSRPDEEPTPSSTSGSVWGTGQMLPPSHGPGGLREHVGGLGHSGGLNLDAEVVDRYYQSYIDNMYKLHPFLEKKVLRKMIHTFKTRYSWDFRFGQRVVSGAGIKRKRETSGSPSSMPDEYGAAAHHRPAPRNNSMQMTAYIEHSVANAIILLVLALGKICAYKDPLPGPAQASAWRMPTPHTVYSDLPMSASAPASPYGGPNNVNGGVTSASTSLHGKNMDCIPGLAYFSKAADILGEMPGGIDVSHVQANLLAGLYMGQLARIVPSHWYIRNACTAIQVIIQSTPYKEQTMSPARRNLINFAFWSCLQLESDILAEMDLPASGIVAREGEMLFEKPADLTCYDNDTHDLDRVIEEHRHYSYQITLRKIINDSLHHIYRDNRDGEKPSKGVIAAFTESLTDFRDVLRDWNWDDDDHESTDINMARLRGKYYGAKYIIHRPALYYALNFATQQQFTSGHRPSESPAGMGGPPEFSPPAPPPPHYDGRRFADMRPPLMKSYEPLEDWVYEASKVCVHSAIRSTTAFDKVPARLVITNIFGTAHAQFGNVLVLAATFCSPHPQLRALVDQEKLRFLMDRTIRFLQKHEAISPTLGKDAGILLHVQSRVFGPHTAGSAASSFSSSR